MTAVFRRLECIRGSGIFEDFRWDSGLPDLARINVVYGRNGTGKTSLAGAIDGVRNAPEGEGWKQVSVALSDSAGHTHSTGFNDDTAFDRLHVFSEHFVARSHRFTSAEAQMDAVLTIGERPVNAEERLEGLRELVDSKTQERTRAVSRESAAQQAIDKAYREVSQRVVDAASRAGGRWHSRSNFSAGVVRTEFANSHEMWLELTEEEVREKIGLVNSDRSEILPNTHFSVTVPSGLVQRLSNALSATPSTVILDTLAAHPEATSWADTGRQLHSDTDTCIFCGSTLTTERKVLIDQHFSDEVERLQSELCEIIHELDNIGNRVDQVVATIPSRGLFAEDLRMRFDQAAGVLQTELDALKQWVEGERGRAQAKAENVLSSVELTVNSPPLVEGTELAELCSEHNARAESHDSLVKEAAKAVELHYLKQAESVVASNTELAAAEKTEVQRLDDELKGHREEIATLESAEGDPMPSAKVLTEEVARLLGRNELRFEAVDGRYRVSRFGEPAIGLSVGERTAITLVHFLECVARFDASRGKPLVVIDDPVSSLDSEIFMGVSTYIWTEAVVKDHIEQLILLTHNFELFRQWDIQLEALHAGGKDKRMGQKLDDLYSTQFYEIVGRHTTVNGQTRRQPIIRSWPPSEVARKNVRSTYHHAFITLAQALENLSDDDSLENRLDARLLFPNVARRMLETFLAFKRPEWVGNFTRAMRNSAQMLEEAGYRGDADALRLRLTRYVHAYSHDEDPSTEAVVSPDEVATALSAVFEFMNTLDTEHFAGLCARVGIATEAVLPSPSPEVEESPDAASR